MNAERELAESRRLAHFLATGMVLPRYTSSVGVATQPDTIAQRRHLGLLPRVPSRCPGVDG
jgi:hypothetical protein